MRLHQRLSQENMWIGHSNFHLGSEAACGIEMFLDDDNRGDIAQKLNEYNPKLLVGITVVNYNQFASLYGEKWSNGEVLCTEDQNESFIIAILTMIGCALIVSLNNNYQRRIIIMRFVEIVRETGGDSFESTILPAIEEKFDWSSITV
jgi:hypothetical protein